MKPTHRAPKTDRPGTLHRDKRAFARKHGAPKEFPHPVPPGRRIMGRNCIKEVLRSSADRFIKVFAADAHSKDTDTLLQELKNAHVLVDQVTKEELSLLVESDSHQGFVGVVRERPFDGVKPFLDRVASAERSLVLMLDSINDPQNLGALLRAAECFGVDAVVWSKNRGVDLTPTVSKAGVGASELVNIIRVSNLVDTIRKFQEAGYWAVAADGDAKSKDLYSFEFPAKTALVVGSEEHGIQQLMLKTVDFKVKIPMHGKIDSLNVSQATTALLASYRGFFAGK